MITNQVRHCPLWRLRQKSGNPVAVSPGIMQILVLINLASGQRYVSLSSDGPFNFKFRDISTVNSPA